ncbi:MAG TPA: ribbon-helix-helix protein, CopG family [Usitatibacter sp.]|jgi:metal-responsive CopG/Arc/MetJ family transcriptional regulator|nr:ribbon-helix-helix protein, CopG family [Usitatibacter sp.]
MAGAVKRTISLPPDLAAEADEMARAEGKTLSGVIQDALREVRARRLKAEFHEVRKFWSARAKEKGILTERDLERLLRK